MSEKKLTKSLRGNLFTLEFTNFTDLFRDNSTISIFQILLSASMTFARLEKLPSKKTQFNLFSSFFVSLWVPEVNASHAYFLSFAEKFKTKAIYFLFYSIFGF